MNNEQVIREGVEAAFEERAGWRIKIAAAVRALATSAAPDCQQDQFSSRMCEKGTKGCATVHAPERSGKLAAEQPKYDSDVDRNNITDGYAPEADSSSAAPSDLIRMIVDRDTPPDNRNRVVDHDINGKPITQGDVDAWAKAAPSPTGESLSVATVLQDIVNDGYLSETQAHRARSALATPRQTEDGGLSASLAEEVADVLAAQNWRGDLVERLRDCASSGSSAALAARCAKQGGFCTCTSAERASCRPSPPAPTGASHGE